MKFYIYQNTSNEYCISLAEDDPWHDKYMSEVLRIEYEKYLKIMKNNNGIQYENILEYDENTIEKSTDTWFKSKEDCLNAIEEIKNYLENGGV